MPAFDPLDWALHKAPMLLTGKDTADSTARFVLAKIAWHAHPNGTNTYPTVLDIRYATGYGRATVQRALRRLQDAGLIVEDGRAPSGATRWKLDLTQHRPSSDLQMLYAEAEMEKARETAARRKRRNKDAVDSLEEAGQLTLSGTEDAGHGAGVRHSKSRTTRPDGGVSGTQSTGHIPPVRDSKSRTDPPNGPMSGTQSTGQATADTPMSGTQSTGVRHSKFRNPALNEAHNHQNHQNHGGHAAPHTPLRGDAASRHRTDQGDPTPSAGHVPNSSREPGPPHAGARSEDSPARPARRRRRRGPKGGAQ